MSARFTLTGGDKHEGNNKKIFTVTPQ